MNDNKYEIIEFEDGDLNLDVRISVDENTVWLNNEQIAILYGRDRSVISRHVKKIYDEENLKKIEHVQLLHKFSMRETGR